jgi:hypothetical protein
VQHTGPASAQDRVAVGDPPDAVDLEDTVPELELVDLLPRAEALAEAELRRRGYRPGDRLDLLARDPVARWALLVLLLMRDGRCPAAPESVSR